MPYYDLASELILIYSTTTKWIEENCDKKNCKKERRLDEKKKNLK